MPGKLFLRINVKTENRFNYLDDALADGHKLYPITSYSESHFGDDRAAGLLMEFRGHGVLHYIHFVYQKN